MSNILLEYISLVNYRNYEKLSIALSHHLNVITGLNGAGKTTILDAIYHICNGKSYFSHLDRFIYKDNLNFYRIEAKIQDADQIFSIKIKSESGKKKVIALDDKKIESRADFIGRFPAFMIAPKDIQILMESSVERRKLMDRTISQSDRGYLIQLLKYNKLLKQRNAFLKANQGKVSADKVLLQSLDQAMAEPAQLINKKRKSYVDLLQPMLNKYYKSISGGSEKISVGYTSEVSLSSFLDIQKKNSTKDIFTGKTNGGIHRDDLDIKLEGRPVKKYGSQGQLKSSIIALKIAQIQWIIKMTGKKPILLLDDIFDKLDIKRVKQLLSICNRELTSQVFITDTDKDRVGKLLSEIGKDYKEFCIQSGTYVE